MPESETYRIIEIAGASPDGVTEAVRSGVARAAKTLRGLDWVEVRSIRGHVEGDQIAHLPVELRVGFSSSSGSRLRGTKGSSLTPAVWTAEMSPM